uniref:G-protein coupled receptor 4-like n=1 Tax=Myxine glutinosa TaxID=7769 RepID=UPI00358ECFC3
MNNSTSCDTTWEPGYVIVPAVYSVVAVVGLVGNVLGLVTILPQLRKRNVLSIYLFNLCISDLLFIVTLPVWIDYTASNDDWSFDGPTCKLAAFLFYTNMYTGICFLCCISVDRFLVVRFPVRSRALRTTKCAAAVCVAVWVSVFLGHIPFLLYAASLIDRDNDILCYEMFPLPLWAAHDNLCKICVFLIPLAITTYCYVSIIKVVRTCRSINGIDRTRIIRLVTTMITIFIACFMPYHVVMLLRTVVNEHGTLDCAFEKAIYPAYKVTVAIASVNSALDPLLNVFSAGTSREDFRQGLMYCRCCKSRRPCRHQRTLEPESVLRNSTEMKSTIP